MWKHYFKMVWRNFWINTKITSISIVGLAIGIAVFITVLLYVNYETGYDKWDKKLTRVYRIGISQTRDGESTDNFWTPYSLGTQMSANISEVETVTRMREMGEQNLLAEKKRFYEQKIISADSSFFSVFPYKFLYGNSASALDKPNQAVITLEMSKKYFGNENPVGKKIEIITGNLTKRLYVVSGVIEKTGPSHLDFNICLSYFKTGPDNWDATVFITYVLLRPNASLSLLEKKTKNIYLSNKAVYEYKELSNEDKNLPEPTNNPEQWLSANQKISNVNVFFEAVSNIHLKPKAEGWRDATANHPVLDSAAGNNTPVLVFSFAALMVLLLACINYANLAIARGSRRAKESAMKKVIGANRKQLIFQFLMEAFIQVFASLLLGLLIAAWLIHFVNRNFDMQLQFWNKTNFNQNLLFITQLALVVFLVTLVSGAYPAFILSSFSPAKILKGNISKNLKGRWMRDSLVVFQFIVSAFFIIGLVVVYSQLHLMHTNDPGFVTSQVLVLKPAETNLISPQMEGQKLSLIKNQLSQIPGVEAVSAGDSYPGMPTTNVQEADFNGQNTQMNFEYVNFDYFKTLNIPLKAGRDFSTTYAMDSVNNALINETAAKKMGLKNAVGHRVKILLREYNIIGVVKDNLTAGYNTEVPPTIYAIGAERGLLSGYSAILVKIRPEQAEKTAKAIVDYWKTIEPQFPLRDTWLDQEFGKLIIKYEQFGKIIAMISTVSLLIALMGIYALSALAAMQRTKEIGIRKVFGASVSEIVSLLSKDFLKLVLISLTIASPLAWLTMNKWLENFAYKTHLSWWVFLCTGILMMMIALITVSYQSIKVARANPVKSLKTE